LPIDEHDNNWNLLPHIKDRWSFLHQTSTMSQLYAIHMEFVAPP
jgi:hypothetical protein